VQFGRPIGSFQAIQHKCAEVLLEVASAQSAAHFASWAAEQDEGLPLAAATAKSFCDEAYLRAAQENLQIHGGVGFTWEAEPHLHLKRAKASETLLGPPAFQRARIARELGF
jgi:alkylation response protein AidB-like acyl-CoA dehydrogenase